MPIHKKSAFPIIIYLTGYMAAGKSSVGKVLAERLKYQFIDLDECIVKDEGQSIKEIFEQKGEAYFRKAESSMLAEVSRAKNIIISTGGGTPCFNDNINLMKEKGRVIWLYVSPETVIKRVSSSQTRPLLNDMSEDDRYKKIKTHMEEREIYYSQANILIDAEQEIESIVDIIVEKLEE